MCIVCMHLCINAFMFILMCVCWGCRQASRFYSQSGSISSGRPQSRLPRGRLPTVGTSRDDCPRWGDCTCALTCTHAHSHTDLHTSTHTDLHIPYMFKHAYTYIHRTLRTHVESFTCAHSQSHTHSRILHYEHGSTLGPACAKAHAHTHTQTHTHTHTVRRFTHLAQHLQPHFEQTHIHGVPQR